MKWKYAPLVLVLVVGSASPLTAWQPPGQSAFSPRSRADRPAEPEWEIIFADDISPEEYAKELDYFHIDIGAVSDDGKIEYISKVSQYKPEKRLGVVEAEYRYHIGWKSGVLRAADRRLLRKAGISTRNKKLEHYVPMPLHRKLEKLEQKYAGLARDEIRRTRFQIQPLEKDEGYKFVVVEQDPPKTSDRPSAVSESLERSAER